MFLQASNFASGVDNTFIFILAISFFFLIGITITMIVFAMKYNRKRHPIAEQIKEYVWVEVTWIVIPLVLVICMFFYGYNAYLPMRTIPEDAIPVQVIGKMWDWTFDYGKGKIVKDTLVVPINKPVRLNMVSPDVTHSFYVPAFRVKEDVVPGQTTKMWFIATQLGDYDIFCAEYCGLRHSYMEGRVRVVSENDYNTWLSNLKVFDPNSNPGLALIKNNGCTGCHSLDGTKLVGPSFKGLYGSSREVLTNDAERKIVADSIYIKNSIIDPNVDIVKGYPKGMMQSYKTKISDAEMTKIIDYFVKLNGK